MDNYKRNSNNNSSSHVLSSCCDSDTVLYMPCFMQNTWAMLWHFCTNEAQSTRRLAQCHAAGMYISRIQT